MNTEQRDAWYQFGKSVVETLQKEQQRVNERWRTIRTEVVCDSLKDATRAMRALELLDIRYAVDATGSAWVITYDVGGIPIEDCE